MKIGVTVFVLFVGFMAIGGSAAIHSFYLGSEDILREQVYNHLETTAQSRAHHIEDFLEEHKHMVELLAFSTEYSELGELTKIHPEFYEVFILDKNGKIVATTNPEEEIETDFSEDLVFLGGREKTYVKDAFYDEEFGKNAIAVSTPIFNETKEFSGVFVAKMEVNALNEITTDRTGLGQTGEIYLINKDGYMITHSRFIPEKATFLEQKVDTINSRNCLGIAGGNSIEHEGHEPVIVFEDYRGAEVLGVHAHIPEVQWCLLTEIDESEALRELKIQLFKSALISLIIMVFFIFLAEYFIRKIVKQIYLKGGRK